ncbi:MAG: nucleotidyltransferase domain-containing protein [Bacteroidetes bacterium]|nr:nucleotidyltransferase domain-containing protein [Bacteroidota bacterium]
MTFSTHLLEEIEKQKSDDREKMRIKVLEKTKVVIKEYFILFNLKSLYITGSLIVPYKFGNRSDIDIAVEGFPEDKYFLAMAELEEKLARKIEIIELENCRFASQIRSNGMQII